VRQSVPPAGRALALLLVLGLLVLGACNRDGKKTAAEKTAATAPKTAGQKAAKQEHNQGEVGDLGQPDLGAKCGAPPDAGTDPIKLVDVTAAKGLVAPLTGMFGHAAAMEDVNGDGWLDLMTGTFADRAVAKYQFRGASGPAPDRLLMGGAKGFTVAKGFPQLYGRTSSATFADLDGDGDADLVLGRDVELNRQKGRASKGTPPANSLPQGPTVLLRNDGKGVFSLVGDLAVDVGARASAVLDYDGDGRLDLFVAGDRFAKGKSALLHNDGNLRFTDTIAASGIPADVFGLGAVAADFNGDRRPDLFVADSQRLFVNTGGKFRETTAPGFTWERSGPEDLAAGAATGDLNRDGLPDLVIGQHFGTAVEHCKKIPIRVFLNRGAENGVPRFEDVTAAAGIPAFATKAPHVQLEDFDNDGWLDILVTASSGAGTRPAVLRWDGMPGGVPHFAGVQGLGSPQYWVTGMVGDVDRDGLLDVYVTEFEPSRASRLFRNETASKGRWLDVILGPGAFGTVVEVYKAGGLGDEASLLQRRELVSDVGYAAGAPSRLHVGLGAVTRVDVRLIPPWKGDPVDHPGVETNRRFDASTSK
jgi:hypothetical protein